MLSLSHCRRDGVQGQDGAQVKKVKMAAATAGLKPQVHCLSCAAAAAAILASFALQTLPAWPAWAEDDGLL